MSDYPINIFPSFEDEGWIAEIPDLPACSAFGETPEIALKEVLAAKRLWIESADADKANPTSLESQNLLPPKLPTDEQIMDAFSRGIRTALLQHKQAGIPIVVWRDGKVVEIPADEIVIPDLPDVDGSTHGHTANEPQLESTAGDD